MTKRSPQDILTAFIVINNEEALEIANRQDLICGSKKITVKYKGLEMYQVGSIVFAHIPGYTHTTVSNLCEGLLSLGGEIHRVFLITTAVSCACVKEGVNKLISIERIYCNSREACDSSKEFGFYLPEGSQKMYPATAVSQCDQKITRTTGVQVLLNLNVMIDALTLLPKVALTDQLIVMAVNVAKITCKYRHTIVRKLLFDNHFQDFVSVVARFVSRFTSEGSGTLSMTPPATCKKQKLNHQLLSKINDKAVPLSKEEYDKQREIIEKFEKDFLITSLSPDKLSSFTRCLGLTDIDYKNIEYEHHHANPKEQIHCIVKAWFEKEGFEANVKKFGKALQDMNKELYDNFILYCCKRVHFVSSMRCFKYLNHEEQLCTII